MRPLYHPPIEDMSVEGILYALSDPVRAQILIEMLADICPQKCAHFANLTGKPLAKSTLSQHFRILREAGLIRSERKGVQLCNTPRCDEMPESFANLVESILTGYMDQMTLKSKAV